jgi:hypothetical protein
MAEDYGASSSSDCHPPRTGGSVAAEGEAVEDPEPLADAA